MKLQSPEFPKEKDLPKFLEKEGKFTPEHYAMRIQGEFLRANPGFEASWGEEIGGKTNSRRFRGFFDDNEDLCKKLFNDPERKKDLFEMIRQVLVGEPKE